jgi:hypothetical protein
MHRPFFPQEGEGGSNGFAADPKLCGEFVF